MYWIFILFYFLKWYTDAELAHGPEDILILFTLQSKGSTLIIIVDTHLISCSLFPRNRKFEHDKHGSLICEHWPCELMPGLKLHFWIALLEVLGEQYMVTEKTRQTEHAVAPEAELGQGTSKFLLVFQFQFQVKARPSYSGEQLFRFWKISPEYL